MSYWMECDFSDSTPWNIARVVHLHRRAVWGATWSEIKRDFKEGPNAAIQRVLHGEPRSKGVPEDFERMSTLLADAAMGSRDPNRLKAWWLYRLLFTPDPLTEKLTLMWHNHFATSNVKVENLSMMHRQNQVFRQCARGPFGELLREVMRDPAMLVWLDADSNRKGIPNENLAREIMELFTLGIGKYTEQDIKEGARALTGWSVRNNAFFDNPTVHDAGEKSILGKTGNWNGDDFICILLDHPATSRRLAWRICDLLMGEGMVEDAGVKELAEGLRMRDLDIDWAVATVLHSQAFFSEQNIAARVSSPTEFAINAARAMECFDPPVSTLAMAEWTGRMGQDLFYPPNVGGWPGGADWLSGRFVVARANYASRLVQGLSKQDKPLNLKRVIEQHQRESGLRLEPIDLFAQLLLGRPINAGQRTRLLDVIATKRTSFEESLRLMALAVLSLPDAQLT